MSKLSPRGEDSSLLFAIAMLALTFMVSDLDKRVRVQRGLIADLLRPAEPEPVDVVEGEIVDDVPPEPAPEPAAKRARPRPAPRRTDVQSQGH
jgi:hypothetical protein